MFGGGGAAAVAAREPPAASKNGTVRTVPLDPFVRIACHVVYTEGAQALRVGLEWRPEVAELSIFAAETGSVNVARRALTREPVGVGPELGSLAGELPLGFATEVFALGGAHGLCFEIRNVDPWEIRIGLAMLFAIDAEAHVRALAFARGWLCVLCAAKALVRRRIEPSQTAELGVLTVFAVDSHHAGGAVRKAAAIASRGSDRFFRVASRARWRLRVGRRRYVFRSNGEGNDEETRHDRNGRDA